MRIVTFVWLGTGVLVLAACAVRLGGPRDAAYETVGLSVFEGESAQELGGWIRSVSPDLVFLAGPVDSSWYQDVAREAGLTLSGPGLGNGRGVAFLAGEPVGDTTVVLGRGSPHELVVHDALYRVDRYRFLNLLAFDLEPDREIRPAVRALLEYVATDVMHNAAVILAATVPDRAVGDSVAAVLRPAFGDAAGCGPDESLPDLPMRIFYGPELRVRCLDARRLDGAGAPLRARFIVPS